MSESGLAYLLDVNVLVALGVRQHQFHSRVARWIQTNPSSSFATCAITELGFVRLLAQTNVYGLPIASAQSMLMQVKQGVLHPCRFVDDDQDVSFLPSWVQTSKQTTDGHLQQLAVRHGVVLATLDASIPDAFVIPEETIVK